MHNVAVCGVGYVGLVTAACLAHVGADVVAYDNDATKITDLREGRLPFYEPNLRELVRTQRREGNLRFTSSPARALADRDVAFIAVGTPVSPLGDADLTYVRQAARDIARHARGSLVVVNKSTVPVETSDLVARLLERETSGGTHFEVASNPEFLREGTAIDDFLRPDRIVIGTNSDRAAAVLRDLYRDIAAPVLVVDPHTAEMIKYAANAFLAARVSFANEIANMCEAIGADVEGVLHGIALDRRIGAQYLRPGLGFGGSCLPKDVSALAHAARAHAIEPTLMDAILSVNRRQVAHLLHRITAIAGDIEGTACAVLGLAFKARTDDVRESPAIALAQELVARGARVCVHDPAAMRAARAHLSERVRFASGAIDALAGVDYAVVATEWPAYRDLDWKHAARAMRGTSVFDPRGALDETTIRAAGLHYYRTGRAARSRALVR